jgi:hypothetical protein
MYRASLVSCWSSDPGQLLGRLGHGLGRRLIDLVLGKDVHLVEGIMHLVEGLGLVDALGLHRDLGKLGDSRSRRPTDVLPWPSTGVAMAVWAFALEATIKKRENKNIVENPNVR